MYLLARSFNVLPQRCHAAIQTYPYLNYDRRAVRGFFAVVSLRPGSTDAFLFTFRTVTEPILQASQQCSGSVIDYAPVIVGLPVSNTTLTTDARTYQGLLVGVGHRHLHACRPLSLFTLLAAHIGCGRRNVSSGRNRLWRRRGPRGSARGACQAMVERERECPDARLTFGSDDCERAVRDVLNGRRSATRGGPG